VFKIGRVLSVSTFVFLLNKNRYKNKCGGDLSTSLIANSFVISPLHVAHHRRSNTLKIRTDGIQRRIAEPLVWPNHLWFPSAPSCSSSNDGLYNTTLNSLTLEFKQIACSSLNLNSINHANSPCALHALPWINLHTLYSSHSFMFLWTSIFIGTPCDLSNWLMCMIGWKETCSSLQSTWDFF